MTPGEYGGHATELFAAHTYERAPPALTGCTCPDVHLLRYFYKQITERYASCQPEYMRWFERAYVYEASQVLLPDMSFVQDSIIDFPKSAEVLALAVQAIRQGRRDAAGGRQAHRGHCEGGRRAITAIRWLKSCRS